MSDESELLKKRFAELWRKSSEGGYYTFTEFLGLAEQSDLAEVSRGMKYAQWGGAEGAERVVVRFGDEDSIGYDVPFPILTLKAVPRSPKFAEKLTHRDYLGALLNLGIERKILGDIVICEDCTYIFAMETVAQFIVESLTRVRHTDVALSVCDELPNVQLYKTEFRRVQALSERLDAIIAKLYSISREDSLALFKRRLVFVEGRICESNSQRLKDGDRVSVRGYGRFVYRGFCSTSKKGKLNIDLEVYV